MNPMMFSVILLLVTGGLAQHLPGYLGRNYQYPRPFIGVSSGVNNTDAAVPDNRFGAASATERRSSVDEYGHNVELNEFAQRIPDSRKPFWYLNRNQIRKHLGLGPVSSAQNNQTTVQTQSNQSNQPSQPNQASQANQSSQPNRSTQSNQSTQPIRPTQPIQPNQPSRSNQPTQPIRPARPNQSIQVNEEVPDVVQSVEARPIDNAPEVPINVA